MDIDTDDLENMSEPDLRQLIQNAQQVLDKRIAARTEETLREIRRMAEEIGLEVQVTKKGETVGTDGTKRGRKKAVPDEEAEKPRRTVAPKYRNPENPAETWTGRGREPKWFQAARARGLSKQDMVIRGTAD
jgi:DNA-binding protein H-NS